MTLPRRAELAQPRDDEPINWTRWRDIPLATIAWIALVLLIFWLASHVLTSLLVLILASIISYALVPTANLLARFLPRLLAIAIVYIIVLGALGILLYFVINTSFQQVASLGAFLRSELISSNGTPSPLDKALVHLGIPQQQIDAFSSQIVSQVQGIFSSLVPVAIEAVNFILNVIIVIILSIYLTADGPRLRHWLRTGTPVRHRERLAFVQDTLDKVIGGYIRGQVTVALIVSVVVGIVLTILQVPFSVLLGIIVFVFEFIPILGSLISGTLCVVIALTVNLETAGLTLLFFIVVHAIDGYILAPRVVGHSIGLHPVVAIASLIAGAELFGVGGALLAAPTAGIIQAVLVAIWTEWRQANPQEFVPAVAITTTEPPHILSTPEALSGTPIPPAPADLSPPVQP